MHNSVFSITNSDKSVLGTGFVVKLDCDGSFIATCGHVLNKCGSDIFVDGTKAKVIYNKYSEGIDIALLYIECIKNPALPLTRNTGDTAKVIGYSKLLGSIKREAFSNIQIKNGIELDPGNLRIKTIKLNTDDQIGPGYSGSPVICEQSHQVLGIVNIEVKVGENYAISSECIIDYFDIIESTKVINTPSSKVHVTSPLSIKEKENITNLLQNSLDNALKSYSTQTNVLIEPHLDTSPEEKVNNSDNKRVEIESIIDKPKSIIIKSRHQFGSTTLARYMINKAWCQNSPSYWHYLDSNKLKPNAKQIQKSVNIELKNLALSLVDIECVVLDEFSNSLKDANTLLKELNEVFIDKPIIILFSLEENPLLSEKIVIPRDFTTLHLWSLNRKSIRRLVNNYNSEEYIEEDSRVVSKVVSDLDALNIPRTPQNCLTILKISETEFDDSPVNRTEMIRRVLFLLFNIDEIPKYKTRPDLKDTEFTLGYFCEKIIRSHEMYFSRESFISDLITFCAKNAIELDVHIIFDILYANNIIVMRGSSFCFKFTYWVYYFCAHRMLQSKEFSEYIFKDSNYVSHPELIEFYTGIDRRRDDALTILIDDLDSITKSVEAKCNFPNNFNLYDDAKWLPTPDELKIMRDDIANTITSSDLPNEVKDEFADRSYDRSKALNQNISSIVEEYSLLRLFKCISAASKALRNSDFASLKLRQELLNVIFNSWEQFTKVLVALSPLLAKHGEAKVDGMNFYLIEAGDEPLEIKLNKLISALPGNLINWYVDDLFSPKMGPLIKNRINEEPNRLIKHYLHLILVTKRPKDWEKLVEIYIIEENKNSFYLHDISNCLQSEYKFSFTSRKNLSHLVHLIKMTSARHDLGIKNPSAKKVKSLSDNILPKREV